jgi:hypothetical protein
MRATAFGGDRIAARFASINDLPIAENERKYHWPLGRRPGRPCVIECTRSLRECAPQRGALMPSALWSSGKTAFGAISLDLFAVSFMRLCARTFDALRRHPVDWRTNVNGT